MDWQPIESAPDSIGDVILWNGKRVFFGWISDDGWHDGTNVDHRDEPEEPQPTHWMPLPKPPV